MTALHPWEKVKGAYRRRIAGLLFRRPFEIQTSVPLISFTFDDFPQSALTAGGKILNRFGVAGTYYVSLGLSGKVEASGPMFVREDLPLLFKGGHELGCHTYAHCHSFNTTTEDYEDSVIKNSLALKELFPDVEFKSFSYPISEPRPLTKAKVSRHFRSCRAGGQTFNMGTVDLNQLSAYFLEKSRDNIQAVKDLIDRNREARGWLIFATHDVAANPTPYGCTPEFFEEVVRYAVNSESRILPVDYALEALQTRNHAR
jgi:peptidoglycan/xylan/chitin deacetylase (PgdA/CDA1 family)